jgi:NADH-quinone oxidoreductase subunit J
MELAFFLFFAIISLLAALSVILQKSPIYSALSLIVVIASLGGLFLLLNAHFIALLQIVIYAGAIMTLFLFVIMMLEPGAEFRVAWNIRKKSVLLILLVIAGVTIWAVSISDAYVRPLQLDFSVKSFGRYFFTSYLFPFELISVLIISSVIGALYIARKEEA